MPADVKIAMELYYKDDTNLRDGINDSAIRTRDAKLLNTNRDQPIISSNIIICVGHEMDYFTLILKLVL